MCCSVVSFKCNKTQTRNSSCGMCDYQDDLILSENVPGLFINSFITALSYGGDGTNHR